MSRPAPWAGRVAISPDGRRIVYVGRGEGTTRLWIKDADQVYAHGPGGHRRRDSAPFFSPDGRQLGFVKDGRTVRILPLEGGLAAHPHRQRQRDRGRLGQRRLRLFRGRLGNQPDSRHRRPFRAGVQIPAADHVIGPEWPVVLPGSRESCFRRRHDGQRPRRLRDRGPAAPQGRGTCAAPRRLRPLFAYRSPRRGHLRRQAARRAVRPRQAGALRTAGRALRRTRSQSIRRRGRAFARPAP